MSDLTESRDRLFNEFDTDWKENEERSAGGSLDACVHYFAAGFAAAMDVTTATRSDLDGLRADRGALEEHIGVYGGCRTQTFLGHCADCDQYYRLDDRVLELEKATESVEA